MPFLIHVSFIYVHLIKSLPIYQKVTHGFSVLGSQGYMMPSELPTEKKKIELGIPVRNKKLVSNKRRTFSLSPTSEPSLTRQMLKVQHIELQIFPLIIEVDSNLNFAIIFFTAKNR